MTLEDITKIRIVRRFTNWDGKNWHQDPRPFSEVLITACGVPYCTRLFHTIDDSPHARAAQAQDFLRRQNRAQAV